ncbi:MAG: exonuclease sbcCD subunit D [Clostridium sp. CAG:217_53_7]|nr:MAG: exonuclease sbcCD subunit D [Clostridium sp. CAG:217_53_7]
MKFLHLSDLHLGKRVHGFSMLEDQAYILQQVIDCIAAEQPDGVLICGDIYDKAVPSAEAVALCDDFFYHLAQRKVPVFAISGNHDSPERLAFGSRLMDGSGVHFSPVYDGGVQPFVLSDKWGEVGIYMLPFVKPAHVRRYFPETEIDSYTDALSAAVGAMQVDTSRRNVLLTHQFVTGAATSDSEELSVGGTDNVDGSVFDPFDYVALGHIHRPQNMGSPRLRYCGSPLKYSFSEAEQQKSVTVVELEEKGRTAIRTLLLQPQHDLRKVKGTYLEVTARSFYESSNCEDYLQITLTDEEDVVDGLAKLRTIYPNLIRLEYDNRRTRENGEIAASDPVQQKTELELFQEFYEMQNNQPMSGQQHAYVRKLIQELKE